MYGEIFRRNAHASGVIPQISLIMGPCAGGAVYSPAITDFVVMVDQTSHMFITGPDVIKTVTGEDVGMEELGGARTHNTTSGNAHHLAGDEKDAFEYVKALLSYLPSNNLDEAAGVPRGGRPRGHRRGPRTRHADPGLGQPALRHAHGRSNTSLDDGEFLETQSLFAPNILTGFGRIEGRPVGHRGQPAAAVRRHAWTSTPPRRRRASCGPATASTSP